MKTDIAILGGGIVGSSIAWHLATAAGAGDVVVIERDPTYEFAATPRGNGGIRQLFSLPENIAMAQYGLAFYRDFHERLAVDGVAADIGFKRQGYLFLSDDGGAEQMIANHGVQTGHGVRAYLLDGPALQARFPSLNVDDIAVAVHSPDDAWIDPYAALMAFRRAAAAAGARFVTADIKGWHGGDGRAARVTLADGATCEADTFILACGAWSAEVASLIGLTVPVEPMSSESYYFK